MEHSPSDSATFANLRPSTIELVQEFQLKLDDTFEGEQRQMAEEALLLSCEVHADQSDRSDGTPYAEHPLMVANNVLDSLEKPDFEIIIAALLHDSVEDQAEKLAAKLRFEGIMEEANAQTPALRYIKHRFGGRVAKIITALTNPDFEQQLGQNDQAVTRENKNRLYALHVAEAIEDPDVLPVKLFDFAENILSLNEVADMSRRLHLARKYLPVIEIFIARLRAGNHSMSQSKVGEMLDRLQHAHIQIQAYVK